MTAPRLLAWSNFRGVSEAGFDLSPSATSYPFITGRLQTSGSRLSKEQPHAPALLEAINWRWDLKIVISGCSCEKRLQNTPLLLNERAAIVKILNGGAAEVQIWAGFLDIE